MLGGVCSFGLGALFSFLLQASDIYLAGCGALHSIRGLVTLLDSASSLGLAAAQSPVHSLH